MNVVIGNNIPAMKYRLDLLMATYPWVDMVLFSELAPYGYLLSYAQPLPGEIDDVFCEMAMRHKVWLIPGSIYEKKDGKIYNTATVINPKGEIVGRYRKMFPFLPFEAGVEPGEEFLLFKVPEVGTFGISICYDMWFPETTRTMAVQGAEVILHPTLTGTIDREIELSIVHASAAINQCYIFDINGLGAGGTGRSIICGPDGNIIYKAGGGEELIPIEIDLDLVHRSRERGVRGLGQPLKSFRDSKIHFSIYEKNTSLPYLQSLGPLEKMKKRMFLEPQANENNSIATETSIEK
ncbi:MAG: carbon-nitrogen hydrolase family protein [Bacteroidia bacterium]|nr:carbon-nitrogen hydrolase family protein [Bacteroidia bacterium]